MGRRAEPAKVELGMEISGLDLAIVHHMIDLIKEKKTEANYCTYIYVRIHVEGQLA